MTDLLFNLLDFGLQELYILPGLIGPLVSPRSPVLSSIRSCPISPGGWVILALDHDKTQQQEPQ